MEKKVKDFLNKVVEDKKIVEKYISGGRKDHQLRDEIKKRGIKFVNPFEGSQFTGIEVNGKII